MMDDKNIPQMDQSWSAAEKMLDKHFRKRRLLIWFLSLIIPVLIIGFAIYLHKNNMPDKNFKTDSSHDVASSGLSEKVDVSQENDPRELLKFHNASADVDSQIETIPPAIMTEKLSYVNNTFVNKPHSEKKSSISKRRIRKSNVINGSITLSEKVVSQPDEMQNTVEKIDLAFPVKSGYLPSEKSDVDVNSIYSSSDKKSFYSKIGWELGVYGGSMHIRKNLSSVNGLDNYLLHRKNEEEAVLNPSIGIALTAGIKSFSITVGAEYSVYGEKTNYYPYSNQQTIIDNSLWQTFLVSYTDVDTAYIMGNPLFLSTVLQRQDSSFVSDSDTIYEYKYDKQIAERNGYNRYYFFELPVDISYYLSRGRMGFGVSAGISPALLVNERGNYIRSDGKGLDSFDEIKYFRKVVVNARVSADIYYRLSARTKVVMRPQLRTNLNSVFKSDFGVRQKYYSAGVLFGISYFLN